MNLSPIHTLSTLSVTDITGKIVINIVKKHTEDHQMLTHGENDTLKTEIYFLSANATGSEDEPVIRLIKY